MMFVQEWPFVHLVPFLANTDLENFLFYRVFYYGELKVKVINKDLNIIKNYTYFFLVRQHF